MLDWGYDTLLSQAVDCNDLRADAYPGGADIWYDGHDDDCAGDNDFDADNDCYMWDVDTNSVKYQDFLETYHPTGAPWLTANGGLCDEVWDDCLDQENPAAYAFVQPSTVYPGAPDTYYDGIDSDCACDNDFDADGDGVMPDGYDNEFAEFNIDWGCNLVELAGDCNDNDADTAPGNLERLGDGADSDCDLDPNTTPFGFGTTDWYNPRPPRIERTADHYALSLIHI